MSIRVALSAMPGAGFAAAALPLLAEGVVQGLEWTYELGFGPEGVSPALDALLGAYASEGALSFHGVSASPLGGCPTDFRASCDALAVLAKRHRPSHLSEHFGFASGAGFRRAAPMPAPFTKSSVERARARLSALGDAARTRVGMENLAFAFSPRDVDAEPDFLDAIVRPLGGFVVLDLHNLYCRAQNFDVDPAVLLGRYPVDLVECVHVSGGSESEVPGALGGGRVRRDTHDDAVPEDVFALLDVALVRFPRVRQVVLERVPEALVTKADQAMLRDEYRRLVRLVDAWSGSAPDSPRSRVDLSLDVAPRDSDERTDLGFQDAILAALDASGDVESLRRALRDDPRTCHFANEREAMEPRMLDVAMRLHRRWAQAF